MHRHVCKRCDAVWICSSSHCLPFGADNAVYQPSCRLCPPRRRGLLDPKPSAERRGDARYLAVCKTGDYYHPGGIVSTVLLAAVTAATAVLVWGFGG